MIRPKLGFRNRSALEQLNICQRVIASVSRAPQEQRRDVNLDETAAAVDAARVSHERVMKLKADLKAETRLRDVLLREARRKVTRANLGHASNLNLKPDGMREAGMELGASKRRTVGAPAKVTNLRAQPSVHASTVALRWDRSVRRCAFLIQVRLDGEPGAEWWTQPAAYLQQRCVIKELKSGGKYWIRVCATNAHGPGPWSNPVSARVK